MKNKIELWVNHLKITQLMSIKMHSQNIEQ